VLLGSQTRYNGSRGHLMRFSATGDFLGAYDFGWDITPAVVAHDNTFSVVIKDNHYGGGSYCNDASFCPPTEESYGITRLSADLRPEWTFVHSNADVCTRQPDNSVTCVTERPRGSEWCINAPAVDANGVVYGLNEDGNLWAIGPDGRERGRIFLERALGAAYTPVSMDARGRIYAQNYGRLFAVGE
jgi:hypothetical protein